MKKTFVIEFDGTVGTIDAEDVQMALDEAMGDVLNFKVSENKVSENKEKKDKGVDKGVVEMIQQLTKLGGVDGGRKNGWKKNISYTNNPGWYDPTPKWTSDGSDSVRYSGYADNTS